MESIFMGINIGLNFVMCKQTLKLWSHCGGNGSVKMPLPREHLHLVPWSHFRQVSVCSQGGGVRGGGGACVVPGACAWCQGRVWCRGGMCGAGGHLWCPGGKCGAGGHLWCPGGMLGARGVCVGYDEIRYASYWNEFLCSSSNITQNSFLKFLKPDFYSLSLQYLGQKFYCQTQFFKIWNFFFYLNETNSNCNCVYVVTRSVRVPWMTISTWMMGSFLGIWLRHTDTIGWQCTCWTWRHRNGLMVYLYLPVELKI